MTTEILTQLGLSTEEADLYQSLLNNGPQTAVRLGKTSKVQRTYVYRIASGLVKKGLVTIQKKDRTTIFSPLSPDYLLAVADQQKQAAIQAQIALEGILPGLKEQFSAVDSRPLVTNYHGVSGLKKLYENTLQTGKNIYALVLPVDMDPELLTYLQQSYRIKRAQLGIHAYVIAAANKYADKYKAGDREFARTTRLVPEDKFPFQNEVDIYGDEVAFINYKKDTPLIGVVIAHPQIAQTMKAFFDLAWEAAEKIYQ